MIENVTSPDETRSAAFARASSVIRLLAALTFLFIGLKIASYGYLPPSDARRHAADAMTGKLYKDVVVMCPTYQINHSPGWDLLLRQLHVTSGLGEDALVAFSIIILLCWILCAPLLWLRCPDAWLAAVFLFNLAEPSFVARLCQARPFLLTEGTLIAVLITWTRPGNPGWLKIILTAAGFALSVWMHGAWYLWAVLPLAFFLARQWRIGISLGLCWIGGALIGATLTGHPVQFLRQAVELVLIIAHEHVASKFLVGEFQPSPGDFPMLLIIVLVFFWRRENIGPLFRSPLFWMAAVCWLLGLKAMRYWADWGCPAALVWVALEFDKFILTKWAALPGRRLLVSGLVAAGFYMMATSDIKGRFTDSLTEPFVDASKPELQGWMPDKDGIFYSAEMEFFYSTFYHNPRADWRYILGFEPAWMPADDLKVQRNIQFNQFAWDAYQPWVNKMRPEDRLEIGGGARPDLPPLEWTKTGDYWIGRLPKKHPAK